MLCGVSNSPWGLSFSVNLHLTFLNFGEDEFSKHFTLKGSVSLSVAKSHSVQQPAFCSKHVVLALSVVCPVPCPHSRNSAY